MVPRAFKCCRRGLLNNSRAYVQGNHDHYGNPEAQIDFARQASGGLQNRIKDALTSLG